MKLERKIWLTGCEDDGHPTLKLNRVQGEERARYLERLRTGVYVEERRESCPLCGWGEGFLIAEKDRYGLPLRTVVCGSCGFLFTQNPLNQPSAIRFYSEQYRRLYDGGATYANSADTIGIPAEMIQRNVSISHAAWALGLVSLFGIPGQIALGHLSDRIGREWIWTISNLGFAICFATLIALFYAEENWRGKHAWEKYKREQEAKDDPSPPGCSELIQHLRTCPLAS